ncbi:hypothetical protein HHK36_023479 [Tetracentron sinense]|uniref:Serine-threonine/tyrosine-protein kinase catalytic domain-containing protein n=1 Tax=Tetracentron sinense TaxID=13715 RepID=A0A834YRA4_TETSI|nr:hypothetical protein HHK36_023479 [Tetracentron sinense]
MMVLNKEVFGRVDSDMGQLFEEINSCDQKEELGPITKEEKESWLRSKWISQGLPYVDYYMNLYSESLIWRLSLDGFSLDRNVEGGDKLERQWRKKCLKFWEACVRIKLYVLVASLLLSTKDFGGFYACAHAIFTESTCVRVDGKPFFASAGSQMEKSIALAQIALAPESDGASFVAVTQLSSQSKRNREFVHEIRHGYTALRTHDLLGYMAPEYAMRGYLTDKADVYSFGIVALEIVSGKSNTNYRPKGEFVYLLDWAYYLQEQGNLLELVDPSLGSNFSQEEATRMLNMALLCTNSSPTLRPAMSAVVSMLEGQIPVQAPLVKRTSRNEDLRFKAFEKPSQDSQTHISSFSQDSQIHRSISMEGLLLDSSMSFQSEEETTYHSSPSKLLPDLS